MQKEWRGDNGGPVRTRTGTAGLGNQSSVLLSYGAESNIVTCKEVTRFARAGSGSERPLNTSI